MTPVLAEPRPEPLPPVEAPPVPALPGQTSIFETRELRLGPVSRELMVGRFEEAADRCAALPRERPLAAALKALAAHWATSSTPEGLRTPTHAAVVHQVKACGVDPLNRALETGLLLRTADLLLAHGPALLHEGRLAADLLREAGQPKRALEAYRLAQEAFPGRARIGRANVLTTLGRDDEARALYREAFLLAPEESLRCSIEAPTVQDLVDETDDLEDDAHPRWVPLLGGLPIPEGRRALWTLPRPEEAVDATLRAFLAALQNARTATARDGAIRRPLKVLAPRLFQLLLTRGQC
jgi:tetratricopeptide (TPR) repeat protein